MKQNNEAFKEEEKRVFMRAFMSYMYDFVLEEKTVILRTGKHDPSVVFQFNEKNGVTTIRKFEDDLLFAYSVAVEALKQNATEKGWNLEVNENNAVLTIK